MLAHHRLFSQPQLMLLTGMRAKVYKLLAIVAKKLFRAQGLSAREIARRAAHFAFQLCYLLLHRRFSLTNGLRNGFRLLVACSVVVKSAQQVCGSSKTGTMVVALSLMLAAESGHILTSGQCLHYVFGLVVTFSCSHSKSPGAACGPSPCDFVSACSAAA
jgi:hypothetical protein